MKKTIISLAIAAGMATSAAAFADATVFGNVHVSLNQLNDPIYSEDVVGGVPQGTYSMDESDKLTMASNTSAIGVKGSEDLGNGLKALYLMEWQVDVANAGALTGRDQWVGLKGGMGTVKFGTMSNNYKQMGGKVDPFYRTLAEGRGLLNMQSGLHGGAGEDGGRSTNTVQYSSPKMGGMQLVLNRTFTGTDGADQDETLGLGFRYEAKNITAYFDYLDPNAAGTGPANSNSYTPADESIMKVGGKYATAKFSVGGQYEMTEDQTGGDYLFIGGTFNIDKNNIIAMTYGQHSDISDAMALGYVHVLGKGTNVYAAYGKLNADTCDISGCSADLGTNSVGTANEDISVISFGIRKKF